MTWALVYMLCTPTCFVEYVVEYKSRAACVADSKDFRRNSPYSTKCVPISKD